MRPAPPRDASLFDQDVCWDAAALDTKGKRVHRSRLRADILRLHQLRPLGLTDDELCGFLPDEDRATIAKRRGDLVRDGLLEDSGLRRETRRGSKAIVWRLVR